MPRLGKPPFSFFIYYVAILDPIVTCHTSVFAAWRELQFTLRRFFNSTSYPMRDFCYIGSFPEISNCGYAGAFNCIKYSLLKCLLLWIFIFMKQLFYRCFNLQQKKKKINKIALKSIQLLVSFQWSRFWWIFFWNFFVYLIIMWKKNWETEIFCFKYIEL